jgi:glycosyltransferase involved in cell wall biosynthesis
MSGVSVIVTTRNSAATLEALLRSVRNQSVPVELLVIDNASRDGTPEIASRLADHFEDAGPERSRQRNLGAERARGEWLMFLDSDMLLARVNVEECLAQGKQGAAAVIIPEVSRGEGFWAACKALERACYVGDDSIEAARFFSRGLFQELSGFDEDLTGEEDWDLTVRARRRGCPIGRTATPLIHDEGSLRLAETMRTKFYYGRTMARYIRKHPLAAGAQLQLLRPAFFRHLDLLAGHPAIAAGIVVMKSSEAAAGALGTAIGFWTDRGSRPTTLSRNDR